MNITFSRRTDLALTVLRVLYDDGERVAGSRLARRAGTTASYLPQVVAPLVRAGWVVSDRGPGGGYRLTAAARRASVLDVVDATEGPSGDGRCVLRDAPCPGDEACPVHAVWRDVREMLERGLEEIPAVDPNGVTS